MRLFGMKFKLRTHTLDKGCRWTSVSDFGLSVGVRGFFYGRCWPATTIPMYHCCSILWNNICMPACLPSWAHIRPAGLDISSQT